MALCVLALCVFAPLLALDVPLSSVRVLLTDLLEIVVLLLRPFGRELRRVRGKDCERIVEIDVFVVLVTPAGRFGRWSV